MNAQTYKGTLIHPCERARGEHEGRWVVLTHHGPTGMPYADEHCPHFHTLREAKAYVSERAGHTGEF